MVDLINRRILKHHDGRVCDPGLCDSYGGDCCTAVAVSISRFAVMTGSRRPHLT